MARRAVIEHLNGAGGAGSWRQRPWEIEMDKRARQGQTLHWKAHGLKEANRRLRADCRGPAVLWKGACSGMGQAENVLAAVYGKRL